jgi:hypothetical protein
LTEPARGWLRVFPDITVRPDGENEWVGISREPAITGETLVLDVMVAATQDAETRERVSACVIESCPIVVEGNVRHRIRLHSGSVALAPLERQIRRG